MPLRDHDAHKKALGICIPSSSPLCLFSASASMEGCALSYAAEGSDLSEIPCCRSHTEIYWLPLKSWETKLSLQHEGLIQNKERTHAHMKSNCKRRTMDNPNQKRLGIEMKGVELSDTWISWKVSLFLHWRWVCSDEGLLVYVFIFRSVA